MTDLIFDPYEKIKIIITIGPATHTEKDLRIMKDRSIDFVRINMSHSSLEDLKYFIKISKNVGIPFILDTEGSQIRSGNLNDDTINLVVNDKIKIHSKHTIGNRKELSLRPASVLRQLEEGDLINIDFNSCILQVLDISTVSRGYIKTKVISSGSIGKNKAVVISPASNKELKIPSLTDKDLNAIELALKEEIQYIAVSYVRSGGSVDEIRRVTHGKMEIISKIECRESLENLDDIIQKSDALLIDRGDLSKDVPLEKVPFIQKIILDRARKYSKGVFVATNLLETMIEKTQPTRAEVHDVISTIIDGAMGLILSAETAIGKHPIECINMLNKLIRHSELVKKTPKLELNNNTIIKTLESMNYLLDHNTSSSLIRPHGGKLIYRMFKNTKTLTNLDGCPKIKLNINQQMDIEQIAIGTFSPLTGFMGKEDFESVLDNMRLTNGLIWPIPIVLDVSQEKADTLTIGEEIALVNNNEEIFAILYLEEKYNFDKEKAATKIFGTHNTKHPGVRMIEKMNPILIAGKIDLIKRTKSITKAYELTPIQVRWLFDNRGWEKVVGFHTRNVPHRGHEFIQLKAMEDANCDGLFIHPIIGKKKVGDFNPQYITKSYEKMIENIYPSNKVILSAFSTFSRYAGPREAIFTAICRQNFGCSHFIVGRDHTGVSDFYHPDASHNIFNKFPDLDIEIIRVGKIFFSKKLNTYLNEKDYPDYVEDDKLHISSTQIRKILQRGEIPPNWMMRPEISKMLHEAIINNKDVFVATE